MPQDNIEEIKNKIDIADLIQEYIQLKPAGTNNYKANCPFHNEKTPSFMVSKDKQIWHCFGCGEGGDIFGFIMRMEGMEFPEALRVLAKKAGVKLQYQDPAISNQKTKLLDICKAAAAFYHKILLDHPKAQFVRDYLVKRQVKNETVDTWKLGYAPEAWDTLNKYLVERGFKEEDIFLAGLTLKKDRGVGYNDRFRHRLMFPINDIHGNVIGFGGRWLGEEKENVGKYINSPQTLIYNKSYVVYGLDKARQEIKKQKLAVVVEGYMDCLSSHQAGVINVVASSGTALTPEQVKMLKRYTNNLAFAFDQDIAGDAAVKRGIEVAWQAEMNTKIIHLPEAKDPDELIQKNAAAWPEAIKKAQSIMEYYFATTLKNADLQKVEDKKEIAKTLLNIIAKLADPIEQTHYLQKLASILKVEERILRDKLKQLVVRGKTGSKSGGAGSGSAGEEASGKRPVKDRFVSLAEMMVGAALTFPENLNHLLAHLLPEYLPNEKLQKLYKSIVIYYTEKQAFDYNDFVQSSLKEEQELATYANVLSLKASEDFKELDEEIVQKEIANGVKELKKRHIQQELKGIEEKLGQAEGAGDKEAVVEQSKKFSELVDELKQLE